MSHYATFRELLRSTLTPPIDDENDGRTMRLDRVLLPTAVNPPVRINRCLRSLRETDLADLLEWLRPGAAPSIERRSHTAQSWWNSVAAALGAEQRRRMSATATHVNPGEIIALATTLLDNDGLRVLLASEQDIMTDLHDTRTRRAERLISTLFEVVNAEWQHRHTG